MKTIIFELYALQSGPLNSLVLNNFSQNLFTRIILKENWHYMLSYKRKREKTTYFVAIAFKCSLILKLIMQMFAQEIQLIAFIGESLSKNHSVAAMLC